MRKCFQLIEGRHAKFWTCEVVGKHYLATFGRIGTTGQTQVKTFGTTGEAYRKATEMIGEKTGKGYVQVGDDDHPGASETLLESLGESPSKPKAPEQMITRQPAGRRRVVFDQPI